HALAEPPRSIFDGAKRDEALQEMLYLGMLERCVYIAARGMMNVGLAHTDDQLSRALLALDDLLASIVRQ
ncbi:MAG: hypothetical protein ACKOD2_08505, partial [Ilumatobacteraceae bacterium]